jgi:hypothetical protein
MRVRTAAIPAGVALFLVTAVAGPAAAAAGALEEPALLPAHEPGAPAAA